MLNVLKGKAAIYNFLRQFPLADVLMPVEALVPIDARGQIVLPKDVREKAGINAGDKVAVMAL